MFIKFIIFLCIVLAGSVNSYTCPDGAVPSPTNTAACYYFGKDELYFLDAEITCDNKTGHLISIHNMMDNMFITQEAIKTFSHSTTGDFWIGISNIVQTTWSWSDSTPLNFENWNDQSSKNRTDAGCGAVLLENGRWIDDYCFIKKPFICSVPILDDVVVHPSPGISATELPSPPPPTTVYVPKECPPSWVYYETTGFCYKVFENSDWHSAENGCVKNGAHLASIHSLEEAMFVGILAYIPGAEQCDGTKQTWIGLYTNDNGISWQWTDRTPFDYNKWGITQPDLPETQHCAQLFSSSNQCNWQLGDFDNFDCYSKLSTYVCKKVPTY
uniref:C-type lectin domain-containing protein n=1 Tax=Panagrolaimus davidi TaxID=227884 RepID=A0A914NXQ7_9BILA